MSETKLGAGKATGMFYHAPKNTALPTSPMEQLSSAWTKVGDITSDGITLNLERDTEDLKNWANVIKRTIMTNHSEEVEAPVMDTTEEALKTVLGEDNVTVTEATAEHGTIITASLSAASLPSEEAFLFLMKDGDDLMALGCTNGQVASVDSVAFKPEEGITWTATIKALGEGWKFILDDSQTL
ncbi:MAG: hypothetical protein K5886_02815 [Lachnospiraceae bacterium]|nr:hypothetical protein [Lachnospiraceae bacterium]